MFLTLVALGGLGDWSGTQFVGVFGVFEIATGAAFILCPNIWRLPVAEAHTDSRTEIRLAADMAFQPHWAAGVKAIAGAALVAYAGFEEGFTFATVGVLPFAAAVAVLIFATSVAAARWGVAHPERDVVFVVFRRPKRDDVVLPGVSMTAAFLQIVLGAFTLPTIKLLDPATFYGPALRPSIELLVAALVLAALSSILAVFLWRGRLARSAPATQRTAERAAA